MIGATGSTVTMKKIELGGPNDEHQSRDRVGVNVGVCWGSDLEYGERYESANIADNELNEPEDIPRGSDHLQSLQTFY